MFSSAKQILLSIVAACLLFPVPPSLSAPAVAGSQGQAKIPAQARRSKSSVVTFQGVGRKDGKVDPSLYRDTKKAYPLEEKQSSIQLPDGMQKIVDGAGRTIKHIDNATLDTVNSFLKFLNVEAESSKIRPQDGGVGLGVSINLDKDKKGADKTKKDSKEGGQNEFYEVVLPDSKRQ